MRSEVLLARLRRGEVHNVRFSEVESLLEALGFRLDRVRGSHRIYVHPAVPRPLSMQPVRGMAKPYPIRQVLGILEAYNLAKGRQR